MESETVQITLPSSKSLSNRWLMLDYMSKTGIKIKNISSSNDTQQLGRLLHQLKAGRRHNFDCRDAATVARFMLALLSFTPGTHTLTGSEQLRRRPMAPLIDALRAAGCSIKCIGDEGFLPLTIEGITPPPSRRITIDASLSSQFVSALLLSAATLPQGGIVEIVGTPVSQPYINMTLSIMEQAKVLWTLKGTPPAYYIEHTIPQCDIISIEKDWSAASYFFEAAALLPGMPIRLPGLFRSSLQGDSVLKDIYLHFGLTVNHGEQSVEIRRNGQPDSHFEYDFTDCPDLLPAVAVTCAALGISASFTGVANLRYKESNRLESVAAELKKLGRDVVCDDNTMTIPDGTPFTRESLAGVGVVDTHGDHRIAMSFGALKVINPDIAVDDPEVVAKSYPDFWKMLERMMG